ncbi:hypothetical protein Tco_1404398 [Tanacetum coccineum]
MDGGGHNLDLNLSVSSVRNSPKRNHNVQNLDMCFTTSELPYEKRLKVQPHPLASGHGQTTVSMHYPILQKDAIDHVRVKGTPEDKSNSSNDVWEDWPAALINWEISDNDEENCERMTMQAASEAIECESKGEHDGKNI